MSWCRLYPARLGLVGSFDRALILIIEKDPSIKSGLFLRKSTVLSI